MGSFLDLVLRVPRKVAWPVDPGAYRLFLAMLVFVNHYSSIGIGSYAVFVFFVLSGFWVQKMWTARYARTRNPYFTYIVSRMWRLSPVMVLVSLITIVLLPVVGVPKEQVFAAPPLQLALSSTFLLGYSWLAYLPVGSAWSLDIEMQFYILAPLLALAVANARWRIVLLVVAAVLSAAFAVLSDTLHVMSPTPVLPKYLFFFVVGMIAAYANWQPSGRLAAWSAAAFFVLVVVLVLTPWRDILIGGANPSARHQLLNHPYNVVLGITSIPFAIYTTRQKSDANDRMMADLSYVIYLMHWVGMQWFFQIKEPFSKRLMVAAICFATVPVVSWLIWRFFDRPINRARARWVESRIEHHPSAVTSEPAAS